MLIIINLLEIENLFITKLLFGWLNAVKFVLGKWYYNVLICKQIKHI